MKEKIARLLTLAREPKDSASLAVLRMGFGAAMLYEAYLWISRGWAATYNELIVHFTYYGFDWVQPLPGEGMVSFFYLFGLLAACILLGLFYRPASVVFAIMTTYWFLLESSYYNNHYYLLAMLAWFFVFVPAANSFSLDNLRKRRQDITAPAWGIWLFLFMIGVVYFYGGIAKFTPDWTSGLMLSEFLSGAGDIPILGPLTQERWSPLFFSWSGLILDLLIVPLLLWKPSRPYAYGVITLFHVMNATFFDIHVFPWFMIVATTIFFEPDWPRRALKWLGFRPGAVKEVEPTPLTPLRKFGFVLLAIFVILQLLLPFRHYLYPKDVIWSNEGFDFSWRMMLRNADGHIEMIAESPSAELKEKVELSTYLSEQQLRKAAYHPQMLLQAAHAVGEDYRARGYEDIEIYAGVLYSLNGRDPVVFGRTDLDLMKIPRSLKHNPWIHLKNPPY